MSAIVKKYHLFHGAVLTNLLRKGRTVNLCLIETKPKEDGLTYRINDARLLIKYKSNFDSQAGTEMAWNFRFTERETEGLLDEDHSVALVCGRRKIDSVGTIQICHLKSDKIRGLLGSPLQARNLSVKFSPGTGKSLRVACNKRDTETIVARSALNKWEIPGS